MQKDPQYYVDGVLSGSRRLLARTITLVESTRSDHQDLAGEVIETLLPHTGKSIRLGITGVPGVGKSTFIESLGLHLVRSGKQVAVLAVDPSSKRSGGSILGDKTRMESLAVAEMAFIRPSPSGGTLGGVARKTRETMLLCEAAGFDVVLVETVGVGQSEIEVASMVDFFLVLMLAGAGDELQGIKKGVLEMADALAINKADGDNIEHAENAKKEYEIALHLLNPATPTWSPPVVTCSAAKKLGIDEIWKMVLLHREKFMESHEFEEKRATQAIDWMWAMVDKGLTDRFYSSTGVKAILSQITGQVEKGYITPTVAAERLFFAFDNKRQRV